MFVLQAIVRLRDGDHPHLRLGGAACTDVPHSVAGALPRPLDSDLHRTTRTETTMRTRMMITTMTMAKTIRCLNVIYVYLKK